MSDCPHAIPYLTGYDCELCGATPEQMSPDPDRFRAETDRARAWAAKQQPELAATGLLMTLAVIEAVSESKALEGVVIEVPLEAKIAAKALRTAAYQLQGESWDQFHQLADQVEKHWDGGCCPVCQETWCDDGCPLADLRAKTMEEQR